MTSLCCAQTERMFLARHELHILLDEYLAKAVSSAASSTSYAAFGSSAAAAAASASTCAGFAPPPVVPWCACSAPRMPSISSDLLLHMVLLRVTESRDCLQKSPILVVANKVDVQGHLSEVDLVQGLSAIHYLLYLHSTQTCAYSCQSVSYCLIRILNLLFVVLYSTQFGLHHGE